jgi:hypothetical protein
MNNPPAFPGKQKALMIQSEHIGIASEYEIDHNGMTLRDYFAAKALPQCFEVSATTDIAAKEAYRMADAMLKAREA